MPPIFLAKKTNLNLTKIIVIEKDFPRSRSKEFKLDVLDIREYIHKRFWLNLSTTKQQQNYKNNNNKQYIMNFWIFKAREGKYIYFFHTEKSKNRFLLTNLFLIIILLITQEKQQEKRNSRFN